MAKYNEPHLASAIVWWLNFLSATGREYIIAERTLAIPASEYLERHFIDQVFLEHDHPALSQKKIDLYFKDTMMGVQSVFEFKYVRQDSTNPLKERKRYFNDLMRLHLASQQGYKSYFLVCGNQINFNTCFQNFNLQGKYPTAGPRRGSTGPTTSGYFGEWFSFDKSVTAKSINLKNKDVDYEPIYRAFVKDYSDSYFDSTANKLILPNSITTKLIFLSEDLSATNIPQTFKIGIWEIS